MDPSHRLRELFIEQLKLVYAAHRQGAEQALANSGTSSLPSLKRMFKAGAKANLRQAHRLEQVFATMNMKPAAKPDRAMQGLVDANNGLVARCDSRLSRDLANIAAGQVAAHFFIAHYGTLRSYAAQLGNGRAARLLGKTLNETRDVDSQLTRFAKRIMRRKGDATYPSESGAGGSMLTGAAVLATGAVALALLNPPTPKPSRMSWLPRR